MAVSRRRMIKTGIVFILGALPGIIWLALTGMVPALIVAILGGFVAAALTLPGVSAARVAGGTIGMIAAHNTPRIMHDAIWEVTLGKDKAKKTDEPTTDSEGV